MQQHTNKIESKKEDKSLKTVVFDAETYASDKLEEVTRCWKKAPTARPRTLKEWENFRRSFESEVICGIAEENGRRPKEMPKIKAWKGWTVAMMQAVLESLAEFRNIVSADLPGGARPDALGRITGGQMPEKNYMQLCVFVPEKADVFTAPRWRGLEGTYTDAGEWLEWATAALWGQQVQDVKKTAKELAARIEKKALPVMETWRAADVFIWANGWSTPEEPTKLRPYTAEFVTLAKPTVQLLPEVPEEPRHKDGQTASAIIAANGPNILEQMKELCVLLLAPYRAQDQQIYFYGQTAGNGKSTLLNILKTVAGARTYTTIRESDVAGKNGHFALESIIGKRFLITEDQSSERLEQSDELKSLITHDGVKIQRKFKDAYIYRFCGLWLIATNGLPVYKDKTQAMARRKFIIPFERSLTQGTGDTRIRDEFALSEEVATWLANVAVRECTSCRRLTEFEENRKAKEAWERQADPVFTFMDLVSHWYGSETATLEELRPLYIAWHGYTGIPGQPVGGPALAASIKKYCETVGKGVLRYEVQSRLYGERALKTRTEGINDAFLSACGIERPREDPRRPKSARELGPRKDQKATGIRRLAAAKYLTKDNIKQAKADQIRELRLKLARLEGQFEEDYPECGMVGKRATEDAREQFERLAEDGYHPEKDPGRSY